MSNPIDNFNKKMGQYNAAINDVNRNAFEGFQNNDDLTLTTTDKNVANIRNSFDYTDLIFTFPVTDKTTRLRLPAFLASHNDSFSPNWNPQAVYGRADPIPVYRNTTRSISLSFKIPNLDIEDANANFISLGTLVKNLYPAYTSFGSAGVLGAIRDSLSGLSPNQVIVGAPLTRIKFANLICNSSNPSVGLLGYMTNLSITMDTANGYLMDTAKASPGQEPLMFPRMVDFSFTFNPLHEHKVGWGTSNNWLGGESSNFPYATRRIDQDSGKGGNLNVGGAVADGNSSAVIGSLFGE